MTQNEVPKTPDAFDALSNQKERIGEADFCVATNGYFQVLGIPLLRGRMFDQRDGPDAPHVAVISESLAHDRWPHQDPIGHTIEFGNMDGDLRLLTIVGIVGDTREYGLDEPPRPTVYVDLFQRPRAEMTDNHAERCRHAPGNRRCPRNPARSQSGNSAELPDISASLFRVARFAKIQRDPHRILRNHRAAAGERRSVWRDGVFREPPHPRVWRARRPGRHPRDVLRMVLGQGMRTIFIGVAIGIVGSFALTQTVSSLLFGVTATDPLTFAGVTLLLIAVALLACYIPARRAPR